MKYFILSTLTSLVIILHAYLIGFYFTLGVTHAKKQSDKRIERK